MHSLGVLLIALAACDSVTMDRSIRPIDAGDLSMLISACDGTPTPGFDACRVRENAPITGVWRLYFPQPKGSVTGGEVSIIYKDRVKSYPVNSPLLEIPWADVVQDTTWKMDQGGLAAAVGVVRYRTPEGTEDSVKVRGEARLLVLKEGYDPLPIGGGFTAFRTKCRVCNLEFSTAGRSAVECKED